MPGSPATPESPAPASGTAALLLSRRVEQAGHGRSLRGTPGAGRAPPPRDSARPRPRCGLTGAAGFRNSGAAHPSHTPGIDTTNLPRTPFIARGTLAPPRPTGPANPSPRHASPAPPYQPSQSQPAAEPGPANRGPPVPVPLVSPSPSVPSGPAPAAAAAPGNDPDHCPPLAPAPGTAPGRAAAPQAAGAAPQESWAERAGLGGPAGGLKGRL